MKEMKKVKKTKDKGLSWGAALGVSILPYAVVGGVGLAATQKLMDTQESTIGKLLVGIPSAAVAFGAASVVFKGTYNAISKDTEPKYKSVMNPFNTELTFPGDEEYISEMKKIINDLNRMTGNESRYDEAQSEDELDNILRGMVDSLVPVADGALDKYMSSFTDEDNRRYFEDKIQRVKNFVCDVNDGVYDDILA